ncbi:MAG TPA: MEDS domain-containing protein, partial [Ilumatobacteraceae bacterium]
MFYDNDVDLVRAVAEHAIAGFVAGEATIAVATTRHIAAFEAAMVDRGVDVAGARADGAWTAVDASHAMSRFIVDDRPDPDAFDAEIGRLVRDATAGGRTARVYGEMVALLWDDGHVGAAIELESLWNALRVEVEFT